MIIYIDHKNKIVFIIPPKNGNTTISSHLNISLKHKYCKEEIENCLTNDDFIKLIIIRKDIVGRFLSGFYEDLFNNHCYNDIDISLIEYLKFLNHCFINKIPNVNNLNVFLKQNKEICFGNCSKVSLPITDKNGNFMSHIQSQKYQIKKYLTCKNIKLLEIKDINKFLNNDIHKNIKLKKFLDINLDTTKLKELKQKRLIINDETLEEEYKNIILNMYKEDIELIQYLENKYEYIL